MDKKGKAWTWVLGVVALVATAACVGLLLWAMSLRRQVEDLRAETSQSLQQAKALEQDMRRLVVPAEEAGDHAAPAVEPAANATDAADSAPAPIEDTNQPVAKEESANPAQQAMQAFREMMGGEDFQMTEALAASMVESEYADLFEQLALPEEAEQRLRVILRDYRLSTFTGMPEFLNQDEMDEEAFAAQMEEMMEQHEKADADLRKQLSALLTPAGMAIFDEYEATADERNARQGFDMDLAMEAPGMSGDVRALLLDVLVEEQLAYDEADMDDEALERSYTEDKMFVLQRTRDRLSTALDEQQMAEVDRFIEREQRSLAEMDEMSEEMALPDAAVITIGPLVTP